MQFRLDVRYSPNLPERARLQQMAGHRATRAGAIVTTAQRFHARERNREDALERLVELIHGAAAPPLPKWQATRATLGSKVRWLEGKTRQADVKRERGRLEGGSMPFAVTLRLDDAAAAPVLAMWRALAESGVDDDCLRLGYPPHVTLGVWPEEAPVEPLAAAVDRFGAEWGALPVTLAGFGVFPAAPAVLWAVPVATGALLARQAALVAAVPGTPCHAHYRPGHWVPHVTLGQTDAPGRAVEVLASLWPGPFSGRLDRLELVRFRPVAVLRGLSLG